MAIFSTGSILNSGAVPSTMVNILISNDASTTTAIVELEVFETTISMTGTTKVGAVHQLFSVAPQTVITRTANITGFPAYEVQLNVTGSTNVIVDTFAVNASGDLVAAQRALQAETTTITALTPLP